MLASLFGRGVTGTTAEGLTSIAAQ